MNEDREEKVKKLEVEVEMMGKELRYTQTTVAGELAGWREMHERMGRKAIKDLVKGMLVVERGRLEGMKRALRRVKEVDVNGERGLRGLGKGIEEGERMAGEVRMKERGILGRLVDDLDDGNGETEGNGEGSASIRGGMSK